MIAVALELDRSRKGLHTADARNDMLCDPGDLLMVFGRIVAELIVHPRSPRDTVDKEIFVTARTLK